MASAPRGRNAAATLLAPEVPELPLRLATTGAVLLGLLVVTTVAAVVLPSVVGVVGVGVLHTGAIVLTAVAAAIQVGAAVVQRLDADG